MSTGCLTAYDEWTGVNQLHQALLLSGGPLRSATAALAVDPAVDTTQQKGFWPGIETSRTEAPALTQHRHGHMVYQEVDQDSGPPHYTHIIVPIGMLRRLWRSVTVARLSCILMHMGVSSCWGIWQML
jgi:hypothetical protein